MRFDLAIPGQLMAAFLPDLILMVGAMLLLLWAVWRPESEAHQRSVGIASILLCTLAAGAVIWFALRGTSAGAGIIAVDNFRWASDLLFLSGTVVVIALAIDNNRKEGVVVAESHVLILLATSGMMLLGAARDLMLIFLGIELMSISAYVLAGLNRRSGKAAEAALKYFLLGAFSTGFLLYGIALIYGATGSTNLSTIGRNVVAQGIQESPLLLAGIALLLVGFGFKVAAAPFHMYTPDVYEGAPTPISAYLATAVKAAAFAAFLRVWLEALAPAAGAWHAAIWWLATVTMVVGNVVALAQRNIKRLLAYSSVAHAGYILVAVAVGTVAGASAFVFYLVAYTLATTGAFAVVSTLGEAGDRKLNLDDYAGLWTVRPWLATAMAVFMLALLGFPIAGGMGFFAKYYLLRAALQSPAPNMTVLAVVVVLASVVSAGYYLYVTVVMFMKPRSAGATAPAATPPITQFVIGVAAILLLVFGVFPTPVIRLAERSVPSMAWQLPTSPPMSLLRERR
ncbi:MAG: NADH-quinone oxidoreductase subunit N [Gemmatimonadaceae bacterium]